MICDWCSNCETDSLADKFARKVFKISSLPFSLLHPLSNSYKFSIFSNFCPPCSVFLLHHIKTWDFQVCLESFKNILCLSFPPTLNHSNNLVSYLILSKICFVPVSHDRGMELQACLESF